MIPHQWYAICESRQLKRQPVGLQRLGERFVLWRNADGQPVCMDDRCAHRGVALSLGSVQNGTIQCRYHGLRYNCEGACVRVPCAGDDAPISKALRVRRWTVREEHGLIWLYWGDPGREPAKVPWIDEIPRDPRECISRSEVWPFNHVRLLENNLDAHHWAFIHNNIMVGVGEFFEEFHVDVEGDFIRSWGTLTLTNRRRGRRGRPWDFRAYHKMPNLSMIQVTPRFRSLIAVTPVDDRRSWVHVRSYQTYARFPIGRFLTDHYCINFLFAVPQYLQDFPVFHNQRPAYSGQGVNRLVAADRAIGEYLKMRRKMLRDAGIEDDRSIPLRRPGHPDCDSRTNGHAGRSLNGTSDDYESAVTSPASGDDLGLDRKSFQRARDQGTQGPWGRAASWMVALAAYPLLAPSTVASHMINAWTGRDSDISITERPSAAAPGEVPAAANDAHTQLDATRVEKRD